MGWMQFVQQGMQMAGGMFDTAADAKDTQTQKRIGYATADANEERIRRDSAERLGMQRAAAAQSGFDSSSGSFLSLQGESAANAELDALTERFKGQMNAWQMDEQRQRAEDKLNFVLDPIGTQLGGSKGGRASMMLLSPLNAAVYGANRKLTGSLTKG